MKAGILQKKTSNNNQADSSLVSSHDTGKDVAFLHESDHQSPSFFSPSSIQPKLTIGQPNDQYEQEADQTADQVLQRLADTSKHNPEIKAQDNNVNTALVQPKFQPTPLNISRIQRDSSKGENEEERQEEPKEDDQQAIQLKCSDCDTPEDIQTKREQGLSSPDGWRIQKPFSATEVGCRTANNGIAQRKCAQCEGEMEGPELEEGEDPGEYIMRMPDFGTEGPPEEQENIQLKCAECAEKEELQAKATDNSAPRQAGKIENQLNATKGAGRPLHRNTRSEMEQAFGRDFSGVRVHTHNQAIQMNRGLGAQAFTHGNDIYFNSGKYDPESNTGKHLLAHELTHTVQQGASNNGLQAKLEVNAEYLTEEGLENEGGALNTGQAGGGGNAPAAPAENAGSEDASTTEGENSSREVVDSESSSPVDGGGADSSSTGETDGAGSSNDQSSTIDESGSQVLEAGDCTPECYSEASEQPENEPDEAPPNPPPGQVDAEASEGDEEDLPEIDDCPPTPVEAAASNPDASVPSQTSGSESAESGEGAISPENGNFQMASNEVGAGSGGGGGAAGGAAQQGGADEAFNMPMTEVIGSAESQRSISVGVFEASSEALDITSARTGKLRSGVQFADNATENQTLQNQRILATGRTNRFFTNVANQLDKATSFAMFNVPDQLGLTAESSKATIGSSIEAQKAAISARIQQARAQAYSKAQLTRNEVTRQAEAYIAYVNDQTAAAIESLTITHFETMGQVNEKETSTLDGLNEIYAEGRTNMEELGTTIGGECITKGAEFAATYEGFSHCTENGFWDGNLSQRRAAAQADAARSVADAFQERMVDAARKRAREVTRDGRKKDRCSVIASASQSRDTLDEQLPSLIEAFEKTRESAIQQAEATKSSLIASINASLTSTINQLDQQEQTQHQAINDTGYMQQVLQEQISHAAAGSVQQGVQTAINAVQDAMFDAYTRFGTSQVPNPPILENALTQVEQNIRGALDGLYTSIGMGTSAAESQLSDALSQALVSLEGITQSNDEATSALIGGFSAGMNTIAGTDNFASQRTSFTTQVQQSMEAGNQALMQTFTAFQESCDTTIEEANTTVAQAYESLESNLRQSRQGLECAITRKATEAASKEAPAWKRALAVLLVVVVIVIVIAVTVVTAGGALAGLGPLAAIGAGALIGAAVGAVTSGLITMAQNLWTNQDVMTGVGKAMLIGAATGFIGGGLGAAAGAGVGAIFSTASKGVQVAAQFATAMITGGGFDVVSQYVMGGFSFENFSWGQLGFTFLTTAITFGIGHAAGARAGAPVVDTPESTPTLVDAPDATPVVVDAPEVTPTIVDTPEPSPVPVDAPESPTTVVDAPESPTAVVDTPESPSTIVDSPESSSTPVDAPESPSPAGDAPESLPTDVDTPEPNTSDAPERRGFDTEEIRESFAEDTASTPEIDQAEHVIHSDDVREQMNSMGSKSSTRAEREQALANYDRETAARRSSLDEDGFISAPDERPSTIFDDPNAPTPRSGEPLQRPPLRENSKAIIEASADTNAQGQFVDPEGNVIIEPEYGHIYGHENRRIVAAGEELGLSQSQLNEYVNSRPEFFQIEERAVNVSHANEMPGLEPYDHIIADMEIFFGL